MKHSIWAGLFLGIAILVVVAGMAGIMRARGAAARLHFVMWMGMFSPPCVMMAVLCEEGFSQAGLKAILICLLLTVQGPVLAHVLGRAVWAREHHMEMRKSL